MDIETQNAVELFFPSPSFPQIYYEAVSNSLDAQATTISIVIDVEGFDAPSTLTLTITDDGEGFTDDRYARFCKLLKPEDRFHKGLGRLVFLKYFGDINVVSRFAEKERTFKFSTKFDGRDTVRHKDGSAKLTTLCFKKFIGERLRSYDDVRPRTVKARLLEELFPRLYELKQKDSVLTITVSLRTRTNNLDQHFYDTDESLTLDQLPHLTRVKIKDSSLDLFQEITMAYTVQREFGKTSATTAICIDQRSLPMRLIEQSAIPKNHQVIFLFQSPYFDGKTDPSRQRLALSNEAEEKMLTSALRRQVASVLEKEIPSISQTNRTTEEYFRQRFPHLTGYFEAETVGLIQRDEALEIAQRRFFKDQREVLEADHLDEKQYEKSLDLSSRTLTEYILYRQLIIERLRKMHGEDSEADIHDLIVPRYRTFHGVDLAESVYTNNAWILDDKFMSFSVVLSEARLSKLIAAITLVEEGLQEETRPDITLIFSNDPDDAAKVDVVVVELKKKTDDEKENAYAITQLLQRAEKLVANCPKVQRIWYYAILQINESFAGRLRQMGYSPLFSFGHVFYREATTISPDGVPIPTPTFVVSFDAVIRDAEARNETFLKLLKDGIKRRNSPTQRVSADPSIDDPAAEPAPVSDT